MSQEVEGVDWDMVTVIPARTGQYQIQPGTTSEYPILFKKTELPAVPALYDPTLRQMCIGFNDIRKYLVDSGLLPWDYEP